MIIHFNDKYITVRAVFVVNNLITVKIRVGADYYLAEFEILQIKLRKTLAFYLHLHAAAQYSDQICYYLTV